MGLRTFPAEAERMVPKLQPQSVIGYLLPGSVDLAPRVDQLRPAV